MAGAFTIFKPSAAATKGQKKVSFKSIPKGVAVPSYTKAQLAYLLTKMNYGLVDLLPSHWEKVFETYTPKHLERVMAKASSSDSSKPSRAAPIEAAVEFVKSETGPEGKKNDTLNKLLGRRQAARAKAAKSQFKLTDTNAAKQARIKEKEARRLALLKKAKTNQTPEPERKQNLDNRRFGGFGILDEGVRSGDKEYRKTLPPRLPPPTDVSVYAGGLPDSGDQDSILFAIDAEKAPPVAAKTISKGVWESLLSGGTTSPRGDIGDSGTFEHPEGRPDLRRGGLTNNKNKKRSDARTNRIVAEYSKIKKSKKKVATNNGKKRTK